MTKPARTFYHATTVRTAQFIADGEGLDPAMSERFDHVFLFDALENALWFVRTYAENFHDTGPAILAVDVTGLRLSADPQRPPLPGAWRSDVLIDHARILGQYEITRTPTTTTLGRFVSWRR